MKKILVLAFVVLTAFNLNAQNTPESGVSGSPYLMIIRELPALRDVELTKTDVDVNVSGVIADVTVKQYYKSTSNQVLEAVYVFPASVHAAVYSMKMKIGSREIVAVIKEKEQARKDYEQAKSEGKRASLLVQDRPNLFQMNLANIAPGDLIEIEMKYTEMLVPDDKIYTFSFPTIVAPRYGNEQTSDNTIISNSNDTRLLSNSAFDIRFNLISPVPIDGIECITHEVNYGGETANHSLITLKDSEKNGAPKDFVVKYKLAGDLINSGLLLSKGEGKNTENFFLLTVQPPKRIDPAYIPPREYVFVLDVSGSMSGFPTVMAKKTILNLLDKLDKDDKFNLILFASGFDVFSTDLVTANRDNLEKAFRFMAESRRGGGTELLPALEKALTMPKDSKASRSIVVITDGLIDFESKAFKLIRDNLNKANVFTFGIGTQMNKLTIEGIARAGMGLSFAVDRVEDAEYQSERFVKYISTPILADIKVTYDGFGVSEVEPMSVPDLFPDRPIIIYGKWDGKLQGGIKIEAINGQEKISVELPVTKFGEMVQGDALKQLWARKQIELLSDYQSFGERDKYKKVITDLGLKYSLMTAYTSFIAVDNEVVPKTGSQGFEIRNSRANDSQVRVDGQSISNTFTGGMGSSGVQSSGSGLIRKADISSNKGQDPNSPIDLNYSDEPNFIEKIIRSIYSKANKDISYNSSEFKNNIIKVEKESASYIEGSGSITVTIDRMGKVIKTTPSDTNKSALNDIVTKAIYLTKFTPAKENWKKIEKSIVIKYNIELPNEPYDYNFQGSTYKMSFIESDNIKYRFAIIEDGIGDKVKSYDKVRFAYSLYNEQQQILESDTIVVVCGIGEVIIVLEDALKNMQQGEQQLILFDYDTRYYYSDAFYPSLKKFARNSKILIKIKVLEINPK